MPIYEYRCKECGKQIEVLIRSEKEAPSCPNCSSTQMERLISAPQVRMGSSSPSGELTCCGREERCEMPPCSINGSCRRD
jgi:putative FmdB family regulatory protein